MSGFEVRNDLGEVIVSSEIKLLTEYARQTIGAVNTWYQTTSPIMDKRIGVCGLPDLGVPNMLTLLKFRSTPDSICGCGNVYFSENAGELIHLTADNVPESGFLDVYNETGDLTWSAKTAGKVPRITRVVQLTYAQMVQSVSFQIEQGEMMMLNHLAAYQLPGPVGSVKRGGIFWKKVGSTMTVHLYDFSQSMQDALEESYKDYGLNLYFYRFAS